MLKRNRKLLSIVMVPVIVAAIIILMEVLRLVYLSNTKFVDDQVELFVDKDDTIDSVALKLEPYLKSVKRFKRLASIKEYDSNIKSGRYLLNKRMGNNSIINNIRQYNKPIEIVFNNAERIENLAGILSRQLLIDSLDLLKYMTNLNVINEYGFNIDNALSMYIPNTYQMYWDSTPEILVNRMYREYQNFWTNERLEKANTMGLTAEDVMILASIVHKESYKDDEKPKIAGVYLERLDRNMLLQSDPTVIYSKKKDAKDFDMVIKRVLYKDLEIDSRYNTYRYRGLPPGPITTPSLSSIKAVLNPQKEGHLFFVADPDNPGYHLFARTLRQHNRNKAKYVNWLNRNRIYR